MRHFHIHCAILFAGIGAFPAWGDLTWNNPSGGAINDASNWSPMAVPNGASQLLFALPNAYTVTVPVNQGVDKLDVTNGSVTFDCQGHTLSMASTNSVTNPGFFVNCFSGGTFTSVTLINGTIAANNGVVGQGLGTVAQLNIGAGGTLQVQSDFALAQYSGTGILRVSDGGRLTISSGGMNIGGPQLPAVGHATVTGAGSVISSPGLFIALQNAGSLLVDAGGRAQTTRGCYIGENGNGNAAVRGAGSVWQESTGPGDNYFYVGATGPATHGALAVLDQGRIVSTVPVTVQSRGVLCGNSEVQANVTNGGSVSPGGAFDDVTRSVLTSGQIGVLSITGTYVQQSAGTLAIELLGGSSYDALAISGSASLTGSLSVSLLSGFVPQIGQSFQVLTAGSRSGVFQSVNLPQLPAGESWDVQYSATAVTLGVIPAPASSVLVLIAAGMRRTRRSRPAPSLLPSPAR